MTLIFMSSYINIKTFIKHLQMQTSLVARILVVVLLFVPLPPWIPHSTRLSFDEKKLKEVFKRMFSHLGIGGRESCDKVWGEAAVDNLHNHHNIELDCKTKRKADHG